MQGWCVEMRDVGYMGAEDKNEEEEEEEEEEEGEAEWGLRLITAGGDDDDSHGLLRVGRNM